MLKLLFNIFIVYAIWQLFRMFFAVNKTQKQFHDQIRDLDGKVNNRKDRVSKDKDRSQDGEYIDYEEIK